MAHACQVRQAERFQSKGDVVSDFWNQMETILEAYKTRMDTFVQGVTIEVYKVVVERTPVKTGRTRGNYLISYNGNDLDGFDPDRFDLDGSSNLPVAQEKVKRIKAGGLVRIINNTPYVMELEFGYSRQAPQGMARITVYDFEPIVHKLAKELCNVRVN